MSHIRNVIAILCLVSTLFAQNSLININPQQVISSRTQHTANSDVSGYDNSINSNSVVLDNPVDSMQYKVGPGDVFSILIWGVEKRQLFLTISPEGIVVIPMVGEIPLSGIALNAAKNILRQKLGEIYKTGQFSISLDQLRRFKVYIGGEVKKKGSVVVTANTRLSDAIEKVGGITENGKQRSIEIHNDLNKTIQYCDIEIAQQSSDFSKNPYLIEGDKIIVPPKKELIFIGGMVCRSGEFDYTIDDNIATIISIAGGFSRGADSNSILYYQYQNRFDTFSLHHVDYETAKITKVFPNDYIVVNALSEYNKEQRVTISGEINNPGEYPIIDNRTRLSDIIEQAGGLAISADMKGIKIIRNQYVFPGKHNVLRLKNVPADMQYPEEKNFSFSLNSDSVSVLYVDINKYVKGGEHDYILDNHDEIIVPVKISTIKVMGAVVRPGIVSFSDGKDVEYYINKSGGYINNSKRHSVKLIKQNNETLFLEPGERIEPGDVVWVPEKRYVNRIQQTKDWVLFISAVATTLLTFFALKDAIN